LEEKVDGLEKDR